MELDYKALQEKSQVLYDVLIDVQDDLTRGRYARMEERLETAIRISCEMKRAFTESREGNEA